MKFLITSVLTALVCAVNCARPAPPHRVPVPHPVSFCVEAEAAAASSTPAAEKNAMLIGGLFHPSGWQGDAVDCPGVLRMTSEDKNCFQPHTPYDRLEYRPSAGRAGWLAVAWQSNTGWGAERGRNLAGRHFRRLVVAMRGLHGGEQVILTALGGTPANAKFPASADEISAGPISLTDQWCEYHVDFPENVKLENVLSAMTIATSQTLNSDGAVIYVSSPRFE